MVSHLAFADDVITFSNASSRSLFKLMHLSSQYERESGYAINKAKTCFIVGDHMPANRVQTVTSLTRFVKMKLPIKYFGCNLYW